jgi:hypothetical protein
MIIVNISHLLICTIIGLLSGLIVLQIKIESIRGWRGLYAIDLIFPAIHVIGGMIITQALILLI